MHIHTSIGSDGRCSPGSMKEEIAKLDLACATDHNNLTWNEWHCMIQEINSERKDSLKTCALPGTEVSLAHWGETVHMLAYFAPRNKKEDAIERGDLIQRTLLAEINDRVITKFDNALENAIQHFKKNQYIMSNPEKYLINRDMALQARWPYLITGSGDRKGFYYTDMIEVMNILNKRMIEDGVINSPKKGYGTPLAIEGYFHKKKTEHDPKTQGMLVTDYERVECTKAMPFLSDTADLTAIAHEENKGLVEEFIKKGWINAIGFPDKELAEKYGLMVLHGSDYHGGEFRKERIGYDANGKRLPSCVEQVEKKGFELFY